MEAPVELPLLDGASTGGYYNYTGFCVVKNRRLNRGLKKIFNVVQWRSPKDVKYHELLHKAYDKAVGGLKNEKSIRKEFKSDPKRSLETYWGMGLPKGSRVRFSPEPEFAKMVGLEPDECWVIEVEGDVVGAREKHDNKEHGKGRIAKRKSYSELLTNYFESGLIGGLGENHLKEYGFSLEESRKAVKALDALSRKHKNMPDLIKEFTKYDNVEDLYKGVCG